MTLQLPLLVPAIRLDRDDGTEEATALRRAAQPWVAGFLLFGGDVEQVTRLTAQLRDVAGRPIFIASDMERGAGQQVQGLTRLPDAGIVGIGGRPWDAFMLGRLTAIEARSVGIDVVFAPCADVRSTLDNPILGNRSFGFDPSRVGTFAAAYADGIRAGGALACAKHFPGHGATVQDSHDAVPEVGDAAHVLEERDVAAFARALASDGCPSIMTAHVAYPALDPSGAIATFSKPIVDRARALAAPQGDLLVFTDALTMAGAGVEGGEPEAARRALAAGCDALLYPEDPEAIAEALAAPGFAAADDLARAAQRIAWFQGLIPEEHPALDATGEAAENARRVAFSALDMVPGFAMSPEIHAVLVIDDDDIEDRGAVIGAFAKRHAVPFELVRLPRGETPALAAVDGVAPADVERALVVIASARAWKGCAGVSPACRELVATTRATLRARGESTSVLWLTPRPENALDEHLPGSGPQVEEAIAFRLFPDEEPPTWDVLT